MSTKLALQDVYSTNFVTYYKTHAAHINIVGRNFYNDHKLLGKIYEDLQSDIDSIGEFMRTLEDVVPTSLQMIINGSEVASTPFMGTAEKMLNQVYNDVEKLIDVYQILNNTASKEKNMDHIANFAQDRIAAYKKHCWMLRSTLK